MTDKQQAPHRALPIKFVVPPDLRLTYADVVQLQTTPNDFRLLFFQGIPPELSGENALATVKHIKAVCVAAVVITPTVMNTLAGMLQKAKVD